MGLLWHGPGRDHWFPPSRCVEQPTTAHRGAGKGGAAKGADTLRKLPQHFEEKSEAAAAAAAADPAAVAAAAANSANAIAVTAAFAAPPVHTQLHATTYVDCEYADAALCSARPLFLCLSAAEIKHGRIAMAAFVGFMVQANGFHWPGQLTSSGVTYADIAAAGSPPAQWDALPFESKMQIILAIGVLEAFSEHSYILKAQGTDHYMRGGKPGFYLSLIHI